MKKKKITCAVLYLPVSFAIAKLQHIYNSDLNQINKVVKFEIQGLKHFFFFACVPWTTIQQLSKEFCKSCMRLGSPFMFTLILISGEICTGGCDLQTNCVHQLLCLSSS